MAGGIKNVRTRGFQGGLARDSNEPDGPQNGFLSGGILNQFNNLIRSGGISDVLPYAFQPPSAFGAGIHVNHVPSTAPEPDLTEYGYPVEYGVLVTFSQILPSFNVNEPCQALQILYAEDGAVLYRQFLWDRLDAVEPEGSWTSWVNTGGGLSQEEADDLYAPFTHEHSLATDMAHGFMSYQNFNKLLGIEAGATADQTPAEIRVALVLPDNSLTNGSQPQAYPEGITTMRVYGSENGWPSSLSTNVLTMRTGATVFQIYTGNSARYIRNSFTPTAWTDWTDMGSVSWSNVTGRPGLANASESGLMSAADKAKLNVIENGATADMTADEIRAALLIPANTYTSTEQPQSYPNGVSLMQVAHNSWPINDTAHVLTTKNAASIAIQWFTVQTTGARYIRFATGSSTWGAWIDLQALATTAVSGLMPNTDKLKLNGVEAGAQVNPSVATVRGYANLGMDAAASGAAPSAYPVGITEMLVTASGWPTTGAALITTFKVNNTDVRQIAYQRSGNVQYMRYTTADDTWSAWVDMDAAATQLIKGLMSASDKVKLDGVQSGAQVNPTSDQIRSALNLATGAIAGNAAPSSYPAGFTQMPIAAGTANWPISNAGLVVTHRTDTRQVRQFIYEEGAAGADRFTYTRWTTAADTWSSWVQVPVTDNDFRRKAYIAEQAATAAPSTYPVGVTVMPVTVATGWPVAGGGTVVTYDSLMQQDRQVFYSAADNSIYTRRATSSSAWGAWTSVTPTADEVKAALVIPANTYDANTTPVTYPNGVSLMQVVGGTWPVNANAHVVTTKNASSLVSQTFTVLGTGERYVRSATGDSTWGSWLNLQALATQSAPGLMSAADKTKIDNLDANYVSENEFALYSMDHPNPSGEGVWIANSYYVTNSIVRYEGAVYIATRNIFGSSVPPTGDSYWEKIVDAPLFQTEDAIRGAVNLPNDAFNGNATPFNYPLGITQMILTTNFGTWPVSATAFVVTFRNNNQDVRQLLYDRNGRTWQRGTSGANVWAAWERLVGVPPGGASSSVLQKFTSTDYDVGYRNADYYHYVRQRSAALNVPTASWEDLNMNQVVEGAAGRWYTSNTLMTVDEVGRYLLELDGAWASNASGLRLTRFLINGSTARGTDRRLTGTGAATMDFNNSVVVLLAAGDTVQFQIQQTSGNNLQIAAGTKGTITRLM